jgi:hypothetical protein
MTVIFTLGIDLQKPTGTAMATSPIAESLMTAICFILFDKLVLVNYFFLGTKQGLIHHHYTFSFAYTLS